jgi:hypothetical protein
LYSEELLTERVKLLTLRPSLGRPSGSQTPYSGLLPGAPSCGAWIATQPRSGHPWRRGVDDHARAHSGHVARNLALARHIALIPIRLDITRKASIKTKRLLAATSDEFLRSHPPFHAAYRGNSAAPPRPGVNTSSAKGHRSWNRRAVSLPHIVKSMS